MLGARYSAPLPGDNSMNTFANKDDIHDLHTAQIRFGGDIFLQPWTQWFAEQVSKYSEGQRKGNEQESPADGSNSLKRRPGKGRREKRSNNEIGPASLVDGQSAFACVEAGQRLGCRNRYIFQLKIAEEVKTCRVGMSRHAYFIFSRKDVKCGMFKRVIASCFKDQWEIKNHKVIIALNHKDAEKSTLRLCVERNVLLLNWFRCTGGCHEEADEHQDRADQFA